MMRNKAHSSMQKTYDECYLTCSTAVFFESRNDEAEALRSWKEALEQINYHNAYRVPSSYTPKTETEKALFESLKQMELQCRERVNLLEALKQSRKETEREEMSSNRIYSGRSSITASPQSSGWLGHETVAPMQYSDLPGPSPSLPPRPSMVKRGSSYSSIDKSINAPKPQSSPLAPPPKLPVPQTQQKSRSPSPDQGKRTMKRTLRPEGKAAKPARTVQPQPRKPAPMKAAGLAWDTHPRTGSVPMLRPEPDPTIEARLSSVAARRSLDQRRAEEPRWTESRNDEPLRMPDPDDFISPNNWRDVSSSHIDNRFEDLKLEAPYHKKATMGLASASLQPGPPPPQHKTPVNPVTIKRGESVQSQLSKPPELSYRQEYLPQQSKVPTSIANNILNNAYARPGSESSGSAVNRKPVAPLAPNPRRVSQRGQVNQNAGSDEDKNRAARESLSSPSMEGSNGTTANTPPSTDADTTDDSDPKIAWEKRAAKILKNLPKGIDEAAAKNILNEIVVKGDEVHWDDVAGLGAAKKALKEAVVYPFLRPDLFMGLREPARGMLLFGPPGTGKTMLARAVATESRSTFFAISASSLTSKWHGESEKLVRALFGLAKVLTPSIIFVDEIDSLLSSRGGGSEHEASRRSKTEFLIQWSDLQRAAAGKEGGVGDASRVLVLAATNCPWDIDEAARRRFVRRQYIPLPEMETRETQIRALIGAQKHVLSNRDITKLVRLTDGYSGSDITALAKDAAMGPLRNLGEALLYTPMDQIRPISMEDFEASLESIRPSVSKKGLEEFEEWAREYGERGG